MKGMTYKLYVFLRRNIQMARTYRFSWIMNMGQTFAQLISFFFIGKLVKGTTPLPSLTAYGGDYFQFVFIGITFGLFMNVAFSTVGNLVDFERSHGTLEAILMTPTSFTALALCKVAWDLLMASVTVVFYLVLGYISLAVDLSHAHWSILGLIILLTTFTFLGLGLLSASVTLVLREPNPLDRVVAWASRFLGGVYFPITLFPRSVQHIATWLPLTCALEAIRHALLSGPTSVQVTQELMTLTCYSLLLLPTGIFFFRWAFRKAQREGSLGFD